MYSSYNQRVVVTGIGMITPIGNDTATTWSSLLSGHSGAGPITAFDASQFDTRIAAEVKGFDPNATLGKKTTNRMDRFTQLASMAALQAVEDARLTIDYNNAERVSVIIGNCVGGITTLSEQYKVLQERGPQRVNPFLIPMMLTDMATGNVSMLLGTKGPNFSTVSSCASSADAIGEAYEMIGRGAVDVAIAGGTEAAICPIAIAGFNSVGALSKRNDEPQKASRPFDSQRDGFVMGEGATLMVLESLEHAVNRGATPFAELIGYGATSDAYHITQPSPGGEGSSRAMNMALERAHVLPEEVNYINAHGTSTPLNDRLETEAIKKVFGESAYNIPISSTKSMTGHLLGAGGATEAGVCIKAIIEGALPPTINLENPDPDCDLDYIRCVSRVAQVKVAMTNSIGFGGHNSTLVFQSI